MSLFISNKKKSFNGSYQPKICSKIMYLKNKCSTMNYRTIQLLYFQTTVNQYVLYNYNYILPGYIPKQF